MTSLSTLARAVDETAGRDPQMLLLWADGMDEAGMLEGEFVRWAVENEKWPVFAEFSDDGWDWLSHAIDPVAEEYVHSRLPLHAYKDDERLDWYDPHSSLTAAYLAAAREWLKPEYNHLRQLCHLKGEKP